MAGSGQDRASGEGRGQWWPARQTRAGSSSTVFRNDNDSDLVRLTHDFSGTSNDVEFRHDYDGSGRLTASYANASGWMWSAGTTDFTRSYGINFSNGDTYDLDQVTNYADTGDLTGSLAYLYDGNGNLSNTSYSLYIHDSRNRLTTIGTYLRGGGWSPPSSTWASMSMRYDPAGRRITRTSTLSDNLIFLYAGDMLTAEVQDQSGQPGYGKIIRRFVPGTGIDDHVVMIDVNPSTGASMGYHYYHRDRLGNIIATADASGARTQRYVYTPFGVEEPWNTTGNPLRYNGQYRDGEAGLYYYRARYYDPQLGRFLQTDPVGYADQRNLYAYVYNDPLNHTDPTGEFGIVGGLVGAFVGAAIETGTQLYRNGGDFDALDGGAILRSAAIGGAIGATGGLAGAAVRGGVTAARGTTQILNSGAGRVIQGAIQGSAGGAAGEVTAQMIDNGSVDENGNWQPGGVTDPGRVGAAAVLGAGAGSVAGAVGGRVHDALTAAGHGRAAAAAYSGGASGMTRGLGSGNTAARTSDIVQAVTQGGVRAAGERVVEETLSAE